MSKNKEKIFIQIPSYRDPELIPTIEDCLEKAKYPERLTFGICWQHHKEDEWDNLDKYKDNPNFTILDIPWNESKGLCWARSEIQKLWKGEEYTLQLDSHHRFAEDWDVELIEMMKLTGAKKPIITSYAGMYDPENNVKLNQEPYKMVANKFTPTGTILFFPSAIENYKELTKPIPARFVSGHFYFTLGKHCEEYKYDPQLYFAGDEISLSIRSYTLGYDLFHPHKTVVWHEYTREGRTKHWDDFTPDNKDKIQTIWTDMDIISKKRLRKMLKEEDNDSEIGIYGLGTVRTHKEYEVYAGIDFEKRLLHPNTKKGVNPPTTLESDNSWRKVEEVTYNLDVNWKDHWEKIKSQTSCTCTFDFLYLGIEDENSNLLFRKDLHTNEFLNGDLTNFTCNFTSTTKPVNAVIWPHQKDGEWLKRVDFNI